ncbi:MAG: phenylalanine--tRNA ligase subunit beta [Oscillospiraceae bacterium]|nr:phenylalanine--tRNA ligase subunit beta [Oscillospiraceae bacterium]
MKLSVKWLNDYVSIKPDNRQFSEALTMSGSKVEGFEIEGEEITNVVVGKILKIEKHPDADKLVVCQVDVNKGEPIQIVTGATNVFEGALVPVALDGSTLPQGIKIKKGKLRGVESCGMLCSIKELGVTLGDFPYAIEDGIFIIEEDCQIGEDIHSAIGIDDTVFDFEITSNRPDCLSVLGLSREVAATYNLPLNIKYPEVKGCGGDINELLKVEILNSELCPRYSAKIVKNVKVGPSPRWLRERLRSSGVRPINNLVDITNFVMLEYGQPMHAFDLRYINGGKISVRNAVKGESITTLDGIERPLSEEMLVIADEKAPVAVAGVMGGEFSGIMEDTNTVVFESAVFLGSSVRKTAKKLGMRTEASARFEKDLDRQNTLPALLRACELVEMLGAGEVVDGIIDVDYTDKTPKKIHLDCNFINRFLGISLTDAEIISYLERAGFKVEGEDVIVPSFRTDIEHKADLSEEVARFYGYNNIPSTTIRGIAKASLSDRQKFDKKVHETMRACGLSEIMTYSFVSPKIFDKLCVPENSPLRNPIVISNPLGEDTGIMRTTSLASMLDTVSRNYNNRNLNVSLYEIASIYINKGEDTLPDEKDILTLGMYGANVDFYVLKGVIEALLEKLNIKGASFKTVSDDSMYHPGRCAALVINGEQIGVFGEVHPTVLGNFEIDTKVYAATICMDALFSLEDNDIKYKPLPKYPAVSRDLALICDTSVTSGEIEEIIKASAPKIIESVSLFDIYQGKQIAEGKKSLAYNISMRALDRTLTTEEADNAVNKILKNLEKSNIVLR